MSFCDVRITWQPLRTSPATTETALVMSSIPCSGWLLAVVAFSVQKNEVGLFHDICQQDAYRMSVSNSIRPVGYMAGVLV